MTWIKEIVMGLLEVYKTKNIYELLNQLEIILIKKHLPEGKKGRFFRDIFGNEYIYVSNELSDEEERIVIAHELGHLILHTHLNTSYYTDNHLLIKNKYEIQANKFAAELLITDDLDISEYETMKELSCNLKVTEELIRLKFET